MIFSISLLGSDAPPGMVLIPAGRFIMGSLDGKIDETPVRTVTLHAFYIDKFEVTNLDYAAFIQATGHKPPIDWPGGKMPPKLPNFPVVNVTVHDAEAFAAWAGKRLPTEAEWEKAARGVDGRIYPWGNSPEGKKAAAGKDANERLHGVGSFPDDVSPYGIFDMAGNAWEWTSDWYEPYPGNDHLEIEYGHKYKVIRGGGAIDYYQAPSTRRCCDRMRSFPFARYDSLGFRCVKEIPQANQQ